MSSTGWQTDTQTSGLGGTSAATPNVTGSLNLLLQHWKTVYPGQPVLRWSTLKGLAIHTADECGPYDGPDYTFGWGLLNVEKAAALVSMDAGSGNHLHIKETLVAKGGSASFSVIAKGQEPLKVTVCWLDPAHAALPLALDPLTPHLVNDLDLRVTSGGQTYYPYRLTREAPAASPLLPMRPTACDTVEQVLISTPASGVTYTINVSPFNTLRNHLGQPASQNVSIIVSGVEASPSPDFQVTVFEPTGLNASTLGWPAVVGTVYRLQTSVDLQTWADASGDYVAAKPFVAAPMHRL